MHLDLCFCLEVKLSLSVYSKRVEINGHVKFGFSQVSYDAASPKRYVLNLKSRVLEYAVPGRYIDFPPEIPYPDCGGHVVEIYILGVNLEFFRQFDDVYGEKRLLHEVKLPHFVFCMIADGNAGIADSVISENETYSLLLRALGGFVFVFEFLEIPYSAAVLFNQEF